MKPFKVEEKLDGARMVYDPNSKIITLEELTRLTNEAVKQFGSYTMNDKGAREVMDLPPLMDRVKSLSLDSLKAQGKIFGDFIEQHEHGEIVISDLASSLDNLPEEKWLALCEDKRFEGCY